MNDFVFSPAIRQSTPMIVAIAGSSGAGKTFTALELAMGLADGGKIALIDTEGRRGLHYADLRQENGEPRFRFDHCDFRSPYTPKRYLAALQAASTAGYAVIVTDSFSDEYVGEGGLVDMAAAERVENQAAKWARPKAEHKLVIRWLRQSRCHLIFCIRAEEKVRLEKVYNEHKSKEETVVVPIGWQPICEKNTMYDMTTSFMLYPEHPGVPHPIKLQERHRLFFPEGKPITRESGRMLAQWCAGGAPANIENVGTDSPDALSGVPLEQLEMQGWEAARNGLVSLEAFWTGLRPSQRKALGPGLLAELKREAQQAETDDISFDGSSEPDADYGYDESRSAASDMESLGPRRTEDQTAGMEGVL